MDHTLRVRIGERPGHVAQHARRFRRREGAALPHALGQRLALDVRHRKEDEIADLFDRVNWNHVRMRKFCGGSRFPKEALAQFGIRRLGWR